RYLKAWKMTHRGTSKSIHRIRTDLQCKLSSIEHSSFGGIFLILEIPSSCTSGFQQTREHSRKQSLANLFIDEAIPSGSSLVFSWLQSMQIFFLDQSRVTEIVCHHDRRIQRSKIESCDGNVIE